MKINRIKKTEPKKGKYWCYKCDHALVEKGQKCPYCGQRDISKHGKITPTNLLRSINEETL